MDAEPTAEDMELFSKQFSKKQWKDLIKNDFFIFFYDKDLTIVNNIAKKLLEGQSVNCFNDCAL